MTQPAIKVKKSDLPLCCPRPGSELAAMHPKVFLPIKQTGSAACPYCGARYELEG